MSLIQFNQSEQSLIQSPVGYHQKITQSSIFQNRENLKMSEVSNKKPKQNPSGTRQRGALAIRPTKAQLLRNEKIRKNQEAKRPLTGNFCFEIPYKTIMVFYRAQNPTKGKGKRV